MNLPVPDDQQMQVYQPKQTFPFPLYYKLANAWRPTDAGVPTKTNTIFPPIL